jgi:hypothetical protein
MTSNVAWPTAEQDVPLPRGGLHCVVAIPARNEAELLPACLAALAAQRDELGAPLPKGSFEVVLLANNCTDCTIETARSFHLSLPYKLHLRHVRLEPGRANAGWARKLAMDQGAAALLRSSPCNGVILTTDADSRADSTWLAANLAEFAQGADAVAGFVDADPLDLMGLGAALLARGRLEDHYSRLVAEIWARCDPRAHDPWPNHRFASGASLALSLRAYLAVGGMPPPPVGEDAALLDALELAGLRVRHSMAAKVSTSCRLNGRAMGGAADTMRRRYLDCEAECDADMEPAICVWRRAAWRGWLRHWYELEDQAGFDAWARPLSIDDAHARVLAEDAGKTPFAAWWPRIEAATPRLRRKARLRPNDLPREIARARRLLAISGGGARPFPQQIEPIHRLPAPP